jgi:hypothetical protein
MQEVMNQIATLVETWERSASVPLLHSILLRCSVDFRQVSVLVLFYIFRCSMRTHA